jgi:hypothetical protein
VFWGAYSWSREKVEIVILPLRVVSSHTSRLNRNTIPWGGIQCTVRLHCDAAALHGVFQHSYLL